ncbi:MAG: glycosyltransferase family 2 protein [Burkholderiales bacterium]
MGPAPLISVVIATRDAARSLPRCLESLRAQAFRDFEVVVMDGGSTDGTVELLKASADVVATWRSGADAGLYSAWNAALPLARGEWICFLGADDWLWDSEALARMAFHLRGAAPRFRVVYSQVRQVDGEGRLIAQLGEPWEACKGRFRSYDCLPHPGLMHHRSLFESHGGFDEHLKLSADYELLLRELKTGDALFVPAVTVGVGWGGRTTLPENYIMSMRETETALRRHGLRPPALTWVWWKLLAHCYTALRAMVGARATRRLADLYRVLTLRKPRYSALDRSKPEGPAR